MSANGATNKAASLIALLFLPAVILHAHARYRIDRFLFKDETFALVPAPSLLVLADAAQGNLVRQMRPRKGEKRSTKRAALISRRYEQLIEIALRQMQGQHGRKGAVIVGDKQGPAPFNLPRDTRAELRDAA